MRWVMAVVLMGMLALGGCADDGDDDGTSADPATSSTSAPTSSTPSPTSETPTATPEPVTTDEFCDLIRDISGGDAATRSTAALTLLQRGLPDDLDGAAKEGLQVLVDHATELGSVTDSWQLYRDLDKGERADLRALTWWVTKQCGKGYVQDLLPSPDLPDWLTDPKIPGLR